MSASYRSQAYQVRGPIEPRRTTAGWLAVIVFAFLAGIGLIGAFAVISVFAALSSNLPDPVKGLSDLRLPEETVILDRTGKTELARFGEFKREVVTFDEIPPLVLDATTAIEDKTFWENAGFDPVAIFAAGLDSLRGNSRGASTITQQLVRARLLDPELVQDPDRTVERKLKEILQSIRLTQAFPDEDGKKQIITAYLNLNYYGNQTYGVKAAARGYFGKALADLTPGEAAIIAALPQSPSNYDLVRNAVEHCDETPPEGDPCPAAASHLIVPPDTKIARRRDAVLTLLAEGRTPLSGHEYSAADFEAEEGKELELVRQATPRWLAPHFVWAVRDELSLRLCGAGTSTCEQLDAGGLRVTTTLDLALQRIAEKWVKVATIVPHRSNPARAAKALGFDRYQRWMQNLENKNVRNGALVALDYQTGELIAYVGSAEYYASQSRPEFQPQYDVVGQGFRQPGSAFKPFNYAVGIDEHTLTAGDMLMDVGTDFGGGYSPTDADNLERGPVRVRTALQFSLNIPAVRAMALNQPDHVFARVKDFGMTFQGDTTDAGLALALGVAETRPIDLVTAYGTLANGGRRPERRSIISVTDRAGTELLKPEEKQPVQVVTPQAAWIVTDILRGNTVRSVNPFWGRFPIIGPEEALRPATLKTGTNNDAKDLNAYGYIAPPTDEGRAAGAYALAVGAWNGNSDNTPVSTPARPVFSIDVSTFVWQGFMQEASRKWPITRFERPADGLTRVKIDAFTGMLPASGSETVDEWFITGTQPKAALPKEICGAAALESTHERKFSNWMAADEDWIRRAQRGPGRVGGPDRTRTAYFYNGQFMPYGRSWGPFVTGQGCGSPSPSPSCIPLPTPDANGVIPSFKIPSPSGSEVAAVPCPPPSVEPSPSVSVEPSVEITPTPQPTPEPTPQPTPEPTPQPSEPPPAEASPQAPGPPAASGIP
ncbi:MAG TPA: transglycosylase domain-containing protein [Candidatus Limnocylindrales bacterium]|nr:transglycosylase domain-containing protein [Candidatus Limnocylindrales bacterium]